MGDLYIKTIRLGSGERLPLLFERGRGAPLFEPTVYALTQIRARNLASDTIASSLRAVLVLYLVLQICKIDLEARFRDGQMLTVGELDELVRLSRLHLDKLRTLASSSDAFRPHSNISSLESHRLRAGKALLEVSPPIAAGRVRSIRDYLQWMVSVRLGRLSPQSEVFQQLSAACKQATAGLSARVAGVGDERASLYRREGLEPDAIVDLLRVTSPGEASNPWRTLFVQQRNFLMIRWLYSLGLRRGELLAVKVSDIDFRKREVVIPRRADDPDDPRLFQPRAKTRDRILPLSKELSQLTYDYVMTARRAIHGARRHEFLFVADKTGAPLSLGALNKSFKTLRTQCPSLPKELSPHVLRHSWNDAFSEAMDKAGIDPADEHKMRSFLMGWSETSGSAATYTRRHTRKRANEASLRMQETMVDGLASE